MHVLIAYYYSNLVAERSIAISLSVCVCVCQWPSTTVHCQSFPAVFVVVVCYSVLVGEQSIAISLSVCLCMCVYVCPWAGAAGPIFTKFSVQIPSGRGFVLLWQRCDTLCTSGFVDDVMFGCSGPYGDAWTAEPHPTTASGVAIPGHSLMSMNALLWKYLQWTKCIVRYFYTSHTRMGRCTTRLWQLSVSETTLCSTSTSLWSRICPPQNLMLMTAAVNLLQMNTLLVRRHQCRYCYYWLHT